MIQIPFRAEATMRRKLKNKCTTISKIVLSTRSLRFELFDNSTSTQVGNEIATTCSVVVRVFRG
jgi:hypothetical protein